MLYGVRRKSFGTTRSILHQVLCQRIPLAECGRRRGWSPALILEIFRFWLSFRITLQAALNLAHDCVKFLPWNPRFAFKIIRPQIQTNYDKESKSAMVQPFNVNTESTHHQIWSPPLKNRVTIFRMIRARWPSAVPMPVEEALDPADLT